MSISALILDERTLALLLWRAVSRKPTTVLAVRPTLSPLNGVFTRIRDALARRGLALDPAERHPTAARMAAYRWESFLGLFSAVEPWMEAHFRFAALDDAVPEYAQALRHSIFGHVDQMTKPALLLEALVQADPGTRFLGGGNEIFSAIGGIRSAAPPESGCPPPRPLRRLANAVFALGLGIACLFSIARLACRPATPVRVRLAATYLPDPRNWRMLAELCEEPSSVLVLFSNPEDDGARPEVESRHCYRVAGLLDGALPPRAAFRALAMVVCDLERLFLICGEWPMGVFRSAIGLVRTRLYYRALFHQFLPEFFWGRDDYDARHVIRTQELRRIGGVSLGINHGLPTTDVVEPGWRYIDFDIYYTFGRFLYEKVYKRTWPSRMEVRPVGSFGAVGRRREGTSSRRSKDIVYFATSEANEDLMARLVLDLARRFPDRTLWVKTKPVDRTTGLCRPLYEILEAETPANVRETLDDTYDLMARASYCVGGLSTVAAEAIQLGMVTFVLDLDPQIANMYRSFPGLCVSSAEEIETSIRGHESGASPWRRERFGDLIDLSGRNIYDVIRKDMDALAVPREGPE